MVDEEAMIATDAAAVMGCKRRRVLLPGQSMSTVSTPRRRAMTRALPEWQATARSAGPILAA
jgi:hypothetical protein